MSLSSRVILLACGSYNPLTNMHLRMFELARDYLRSIGTTVVEGIISPVHNSYAKADLISSFHRCNMIERALTPTDWIKLDKWECEQDEWVRTCDVLKHHQRIANIRYESSGNIPMVKLLFGADVLESFAVPNLWDPGHIETMVKDHGIIVITRAGSDPHGFIEKSEVLTKYQANIQIVFDWILNEIKATTIRSAFKEGRSVKYLLQDPVIDYVYKNKLYGSG